MAAMAHTFDICIRGAGVVGRTLALLLARDRLRVALVAAPQDNTAPAVDVRAYALNASSRKLLESLRCWPDEMHATPVRHMEVCGDTDGQVHFDALDQGADALAWIVDVPSLESRLTEAVRYQPQVEVVGDPVEAALTIVCEGRSSRTREELGAEFEVTHYPQTAIATRLATEHSHAQIARQWFTAQSILAFLPLDGEGGHSVAVVWSVPHAQVPQWMAMPEDEFAHQLRMTSHDALGELRLISDRAAWPLQQAQATRWCGALPTSGKAPRSWVLAGDAAHTIHPLAGQGLNLGLADAQCLAAYLHARDYWRSVADLRTLRRYERERKAAMAPMGWATDGLQQLFGRDDSRLQLLRNWGMNRFDHSGLLKHWIARQAMGTS